MAVGDIRRICLFAGYSKTGIVEDYVLYYLQELSKISDVYYLADNKIFLEEYRKIVPYVKGAYGYKHGKYDFGSWQELMFIIGRKKLSEYDELILANDSVFGPLYNLKKFMENIERDNEWDLCGINSAYDFKTWHLSSYFLIFRKSGFLSETFKEHFNSVTKESSPGKVIEKYEIGLSRKMMNAGYVAKSAVNFQKNIYLFWREFLLAGSPLVKCKIFNDEFFLICKTKGWEKFLNKHTEYDTSLLYSYVNKYKSAYRIFRIFTNISFLKYVRKGLVRIVWTKERKLVRIFGINLLNIYDYGNNRIKEVGK